MTTSLETKITAEPGKQVIIIEREFDAPRELVFEAFTDAELYKEWNVPRKYTMTMDKFESRDGGSWRFIHHDDKGGSYAFHGVLHEVTAPERIIQTFEYEGLPEKGHVTLETATFKPLPGGRTKLLIESVFRNVADRDGMLQSGMEGGLNDSFSKLADLLNRLKSK
ncbi:SRPBCC family protein [Paenibacillus sp. GYB003]|uniref:SRPBCC family protein n=1 Tax=Paenibacillus sp. GYB003 TaxID=2994392 RepID=UPI002F96175D